MVIPEMPFDVIARRIARLWNPFEYNPHQGFLGPTRGGKSFLIRHGILPIAPYERTVVIDVKPGGEPTWNEWGNDVTELKPGFGIGPDGTAHYRVRLERGEPGKAQIGNILDMIANEGSCVLVMDDSRKITANAPGLGFSNHVDHLLLEGAGIGISVLLAANSTIWATSTLRDQCGITWLTKMPNETERDKFSKIIGLPKESRPVLTGLLHRQFLFSDVRDGNSKLAVTQFFPEPGR